MSLAQFRLLHGLLRTSRQVETLPLSRVEEVPVACEPTEYHVEALLVARPYLGRGLRMTVSMVYKPWRQMQTCCDPG